MAQRWAIGKRRLGDIRVKKVYKICDLVDFSGIYSLAFIFGADPYYIQYIIF
jgi:hypothetical protein